MRNQIRKGLNTFKIKKIDQQTMIKYAYDIYVNTFKSYKTYNRLKTKEIFLREINENWEFWGVYYDNILVGFSQNKLQEGFCDYSTIKIIPAYQKMYASYALLYHMNKYYLHEMKIDYVSNGARSIFHNSNIQDFLMKKFKFRKAFCNLHVVYSPNVRKIVNILYPLREFIFKIQLNIFQQVATILKQEEFIRKSNHE